MTYQPRTVTLYGVGLLGGSLGSALKTSGYQGTVIGLSSPSSIRLAGELGCIDEGYGYEALPDVVGRTDVLALCTPIGGILDTLDKLGSLRLPPGLLVTDVGSTKREIVERARARLPEHVHFVGGHPMAGGEKSGVLASDPFLFQNAIYVLVPAHERSHEIAARFAGFVDKYLGCRHLFLDAAVHDTIAATVSHVPHILAVALVNMAARADTARPGTLGLAAGGFRDMTRIASSPYRMWHDILLTNRETIVSSLDEYLRTLEHLRDRLRDERTLESEWNDASTTRARVPLSHKGFISPLSEVLVVAKDQPGIIARIAAALARENVNIKDIEVVKVRENEGGTIRLAFESPAVAHQATALLTAEGFAVRER
jgi:prephenate dehydrogenase